MEQIARQHIEHPDAYYRWDRNYQYLVQWSTPALPGSYLKTTFAGGHK